MAHDRIARSRRLLPLCVVCLTVLSVLPSRAAETGTFNLQDMRDPDEDRVPTGARRAAEWEPSPEGITGYPWHFSFGVGFAYFSGDHAYDDTGFAAEVKLARDLSDGFYVSGAYLLAMAETEVPDPLDGSTDDESHVLNIPTIGVGFRAELSPEINLFIEPKLGAVITGDDVGPVGGASAGVNIQLDPGISVHVTFTGLATDIGVETDAGDADLNGIFSAGIGLVFKF